MAGDTLSASSTRHSALILRMSCSHHDFLLSDATRLILLLQFALLRQNECLSAVMVKRSVLCKSSQGL